MATWGRRLFFISLLGFAACSSSSTKTSAPPAAAPTTPPPTRPTTTPTTMVPLYSFDNSVPPPKLINTGTNYKQILQSLIDYASWIVAHRADTQLLRTITAPGSTSQTGGNHDVEILKRYNRRLYERYDGPSSLVVLSVMTDAVSARYTQHIAEQAVVDKNGTVVSRRTPGRTRYNLLIVKLAGHWYVASADEEKGLHVKL